jgi:PAS domain S-box-containing protein
MAERRKVQAGRLGRKNAGSAPIDPRADPNFSARLVEAIQQAVIVTDAARRIVYWNRFAEALYGWSADEAVGKDIGLITPAPPEERDEALQSVERAGSWAGEFTVRRKDGGVFTAFVTTSLIKDEQDRIAGMVGISTDVSAQRERDLHYAALIRSMSEGFALCEAIWDDDGALADYKIIEINPALQAMLGVGPEVTGTRLSDSGSTDARWLAVCQRALATGEPVGFDFHNQATGRWHEIRVNRVASDCMAQFFFDITDRKRAEARQETLFNELNHRVKNNLAIVSGLLTLQAQGAEPEVRQHLMKAVDRVQSISEVHGSLHKGDRTEDLDFGPYLEQLCQRLAVSLCEDGRISIDVTAQSAAISIDHAVPLGMAVNELVTNAAKYAYRPPEKGSISVSFARVGDELLLSVRDSGKGLSQGDEKRAKGLGMKLVRSVVAQVGGEIETEVGPGATFTIRLPAP